MAPEFGLPQTDQLRKFDSTVHVLAEGGVPVHLGQLQVSPVDIAQLDSDRPMSLSPRMSLHHVNHTSHFDNSRQGFSGLWNGGMDLVVFVNDIQWLS